MNENTRKGIRRKHKIMEYVLSVKKFRYSDFIKELEGFGSQSTLNRELQELVKMTWIEQNDKTKEYSFNPLIKTLDIDPHKQIKEGLEKKEEYDKLLEISFFKEEELRNRITNNEVSKISKDFGDLTNEIFITNESNFFFSNIFYSFLREGVIFNPKFWGKLIKPSHFNFRFEIKCNWEKDPEIFNLITELKEIYKKIGYIPHSVNSPFHREKEINLNNKDEKEHYMTAVAEQTVREFTEKKKKDFSKNYQNKFEPLLNSFKYISKEIESNVPELKDLTSFVDLFFPGDILKNPTIDEKKEGSEKYLNLLNQLKNKIFSYLEIEEE